MPLGLGTPLATAEAMWAKHHIHLAAEPQGERQGLIHPNDGKNRGDTVDDTNDVDRVHAPFHPLTLCAIGDSMVAGCGVTNQREGLIPDIVAQFASRSGRSIAWQAHGRLGATMRRVRYRLITEVAGQRFDIVVLCAGSNDIMANRSLDEWREDLDAAVLGACALSDCVLVFSAGQMQYVPSLGKALRRALLREMDAQSAVSLEVCQAHGAQYVNMIHADVHAEAPGFFSPDGFHPSAMGYSHMAAGVADALGADFADRLTRM